MFWSFALIQCCSWSDWTNVKTVLVIYEYRWLWCSSSPLVSQDYLIPSCDGEPRYIRLLGYMVANNWRLSSFVFYNFRPGGLQRIPWSEQMTRKFCSGRWHVTMWTVTVALPHCDAWISSMGSTRFQMRTTSTHLHCSSWSHQHGHRSASFST